MWRSGFVSKLRLSDNLRGVCGRVSECQACFRTNLQLHAHYWILEKIKACYSIFPSLSFSLFRALAIGGGLPALKYLDLSGLPNISSQAIHDLVSSCPQLIPECLFYCDNIEDGPLASSANGCQNVKDGGQCCRNLFRAWTLLNEGDNFVLCSSNRSMYPKMSSPCFVMCVWPQYHPPPLSIHLLTQKVMTIPNLLLIPGIISSCLLYLLYQSKYYTYVTFEDSKICGCMLIEQVIMIANFFIVLFKTF